MCEPATLAIIGTTISAATSVAGGVMALQQGNYQAAVARENAKMSDAAAVDALEQGKRETQLNYRRQTQLQGAQRAAMAANGIDLSFGSALDVQGDSKMIAREDANTIAQNAGRAAKGYDIEGANYRSQASAAKMKGTAGLVAGIGEGLSTALGGAERVQKYRRGS